MVSKHFSHNVPVLRLHLAGKDAVNEVQYFKKYEAIYKELYLYFSGSYKRMLNLKMIQESNDDPHLNANDQRDGDQTKKLLELIDVKIKFQRCKTSSLDATIAMIKTQLIGNCLKLQARFSHNDLYDSMKILDLKELPLQESALSLYRIEELKLL
ncbi:hypothetical protein RhiirA4_479759 [Rhizophagus irregularis]|uniref:Uncharacterized protein n=1 Tax=Rhizophagus irregularis TaxID=588596 RepID=A0A2I1HGW9_9GLOM|nr:hypothetical protein RhiirA4_479759 [Rhizophagus irregularis]